MSYPPQPPPVPVTPGQIWRPMYWGGLSPEKIEKAKQAKQKREEAEREWIQRGKALIRELSKNQFALGDWINERVKGGYRKRGRWIDGRVRFSEYRRMADLLEGKITAGTLRNYAWVAREFPPDTRVPELSFFHHRVLAAVKGGRSVRDSWAEKAVTEKWSVSSLHDQIKAAEGSNEEENESERDRAVRRLAEYRGVTRMEVIEAAVDAYLSSEAVKQELIDAEQAAANQPDEEDPFDL